MITGSDRFNHNLKPEFHATFFEFQHDQNLDASEHIPAGAHERVVAATIKGYSYGLPMAVRR